MTTLLKHILHPIIGVTVLCLSACALLPQDRITPKLSALHAEFPHVTYLMTIDNAANPISNAMVIGLLNVGTGSRDSEQLIKQMSKPDFSLAVFGDGDSLAAATLARALADGKEKISPSSSVYFVGAKAYEDTLKAAASEAGVKLAFVVFPK